MPRCRDPPGFRAQQIILGFGTAIERKWSSAEREARIELNDAKFMHS